MNEFGFLSVMQYGLTELVKGYGYLGVFVVSLVGNVIPFLTIPYLIFVFTLVRHFDPVSLSLISALGASIGKMTSYVIGRSARRYILRNERYRRKFELLRELLGNYTFLAILVVTATALPDDYVFIPVGVMGYSFWKTFVATVIGKSIITSLVAFSGVYGQELLDVAMKLLLGEEASTPLMTAILVIVFLAGFALYIKLDVEDWFEQRLLKLKKYGSRGRG